MVILWRFAEEQEKKKKKKKKDKKGDPGHDMRKEELWCDIPSAEGLVGNVLLFRWP